MCVPVLLPRQCFVDAVIEVFVVGEDDMAADIVELRARSGFKKSRGVEQWRTKPSAVVSVEARPPAVSLQSIIIHDGPSFALISHAWEVWWDILQADEDVSQLPNRWDRRQ